MKNRSSLLAPPVGWICHACGWSSETVAEPLRCPKCGGSAFERTGAAEAVREAEREAEGLGGPEVRRSLMADLKCVNGCGRAVSRPGGRCRTCAGKLRRNKKTARPRPARPPKAMKSDPASDGANSEFGEAIAEALKAKGFTVKEICLTEATLLVRLTAEKQA